MSSNGQTAKAVYNLLGGERSSQELAEKIAAFLISARQTEKLGAILRELQSIRLRRDDILEVEVTSANELSEETVDMIKKLFVAENVIVHVEKDKSLLGGIKVRAHDRQMDYSVRTRLKRLRAGA